jgi:uncharacterized membrane protein
MEWLRYHTSNRTRTFWFLNAGISGAITLMFLFMAIWNGPEVLAVGAVSLALCLFFVANGILKHE